jgi:A/G-specific adenine glycosylase
VAHAGERPDLSAAADPLLDWFARHARPFPWRQEPRSPYRVWVAEAMLQQTRAATVVPYYRRWLARFPDVEALASAPTGDVLALWEGLGYYRRARALHAAARTVVHDLGGRWPADEEGWRALPGVGPYTAAAIVALAFGRPTVAVDGNVRRVGARLLADPEPRDADLARDLAVLLPDRDPGRATEALIELGATICTPRAPACDACPLRRSCRAAASGTPEAFPRRRARPSAPVRERWAIVALDPARGLRLERRPEDGLLGGLWGFPQRDAPPPGRELEALEQVYSHLRLRLRPVLVDPGIAASAAGDAPDAAANGAWIPPERLATLPLSRVDRRLLERLRADGLLAS